MQKDSHEILKRLLQHLPSRPPDGCWEYNGHRTNAGYGRFKVNYVPHLAHRVAYEMLGRRRRIPKGKIVCHHCDNPPCCNPEHLYAGTYKSNARDREMRRRGSRGDRAGTKNPNAKLAVSQVRYIRKRKETARQAAHKFGVSMGTINRIRSGTTWKTV